jgi:hypothetical protein
MGLSQYQSAANFNPQGPVDLLCVALCRAGLFPSHYLPCLSRGGESSERPLLSRTSSKALHCRLIIVRSHAVLRKSSEIRVAKRK